MTGEPENYDDLSIAEQDAYALSRAAVMLDQAKGTPALVARAIDHNLELWVAIRTVISQGDNPLSAEIKENLTKLSHYVADTTFRHGADASARTLDSLININLQISQGLLEGAENAEKAGKAG